MIISPNGSNKRPKTKSIQKPPSGYSGRSPKRLSGRLRDRSALDFSFSFVCGAGVCLSRRAQRADLYKTSTREGAIKVKVIKTLTSNCKFFTYTFKPFTCEMFITDASDLKEVSCLCQAMLYLLNNKLIIDFLEIYAIIESHR